MNKYEKAFNHLREHASFDTVDEMIDIKELVEKAIPKILLDIKDENKKCNGGNPLYGEWITGTCPKCKKDVQSGMNYCPNCGQAIDWRVEDENNK